MESRSGDGGRSLSSTEPRGETNVVTATAELGALFEMLCKKSSELGGRRHQHLRFPSRFR